jgi:SAM-dependent methyltransferase
MKTSKVIVNIGCGKTRIPGSIGLDRVPIENYVDVIHDLNKTPYPFAESSVDEVHFYHVLEHLTDPISKMEDIHRILRPGGILHMRVPHFSSMGAFSDMTHVRPFGYTSFDCFQKGDAQHYYTSVEFKIRKKEIKFFGQYPNTGVFAQYVHPNQCHVLVKPIVRVINFCIRLAPVFFERIWCYWVGGACEVVLEMEAVK